MILILSSCKGSAFTIDLREGLVSCACIKCVGKNIKYKIAVLKVGKNCEGFLYFLSPFCLHVSVLSEYFFY